MSAPSISQKFLIECTIESALRTAGRWADARESINGDWEVEVLMTWVAEELPGNTHTTALLSRLMGRNEQSKTDIGMALTAEPGFKLPDHRMMEVTALILASPEETLRLRSLADFTASVAAEAELWLGADSSSDFHNVMEFAQIMFAPPQAIDWLCFVQGFAEACDSPLNGAGRWYGDTSSGAGIAPTFSWNIWRCTPASPVVFSRFSLLRASELACRWMAAECQNRLKSIGDRPIKETPEWTPEKEEEGRQILQINPNMKVKEFRSRLRMNNANAQALFRHITGTPKRAFCD